MTCISIFNTNKFPHKPKVTDHPQYEVSTPKHSKKKQIIDNKPNTRYVITALGKKVFGEHITALEGLLRQLK